VLECVSPLENDPTWVLASLRHEKLSPGPMRAGSITEEDVGFLGLRMRYVWEVTHYEPPAAFAVQSVSGSFPSTISLLLESFDGATELTLAGGAQLRGVYRLMVP
jgi:hypothetical protein